jgi:hypothetical protein
MDRAIGEVFEYEGEWYRAEKETDSCSGCAFKGMFLRCENLCNLEEVIFVRVPPPNSTTLRFTLVEGAQCGDCDLNGKGSVCLRYLGLPDCGDRVYKVKVVK